jgi:hypothetical protein
VDYDDSRCDQSGDRVPFGSPNRSAPPLAALAAGRGGASARQAAVTRTADRRFSSAPVMPLAEVGSDNALGKEIVGYSPRLAALLIPAMASSFQGRAA